MKSVFRLDKSDIGRKFHFYLRDPDGETIGSSKGYVYKRFAVYDIIAVKKDAHLDDRYEISLGEADRHYVQLKDGSGDIILISDGYETRAEAEKCKEAIKMYAPGSDTEDMTDGPV